MGRKCCIPGCHSGYESSKSTGANEKPVSLHGFPRDEATKKAWCERQDAKPSRKSARGGLSLAILTKEAIPSIFPNLPKYLSSLQQNDRTDTSHAECRRKHQQDEMELQSSEFLQSDDLHNMNDLKTSLQSFILPSDVVCKEQDDMVVFMHIKMREDGEPHILSSTTIYDDLTFKLFVHGNPVTTSKISHIVSGNTFKTGSEVVNTIACLKHLGLENKKENEEIAEKICILFDDLFENVDSSQQKKIVFLRQQVQLLLPKSNARRFNAEFLALSSLWMNCSPALYKRLLEDGLFTLPNGKYLKQLCSSFSVDAGLSTGSTKCLEVRLKSLKEREKIVMMAMDEVYVAKRLEFSGGKIHGLSGNQEASTILAFFISSVGGAFREMVCLCPLSHIDSGIINKLTKEVLQMLETIGFEVCALCLDGHSANRKFYARELCGGEIKPSIVHPFNPKRQLFLLFDPTHLFKNFYSNLMNRKELKCPNFRGKSIFANIHHLYELYKMEAEKPVKVAHKLNEKVLHSRPMERCNVSLANSLFHETSFQGLRFYKDSNPEWETTSNFLEVIRIWWDIISVRNPKHGRNKRNPWRNAIGSSSDEQVKFLQDFQKWLSDWESMRDKQNSLSLETFFCARQTLSAILHLIPYLIKEKGFNYVLTGKLSSDLLEGRFGRYRQMSGGNYYVSVRQILESERLIKIHGLVKYSGLTYSDIKEEFSTVNEEKLRANEADVEAIISILDGNHHDTNSPLQESDSAIIYFVSGYIAKSLRKRSKCTSCSEMIGDKASDLVPFPDSEENKTKNDRLFQQLNRGGLFQPSDLLVTFCVLAWSLRVEIFDNQSTKETFLSMKSPREVFISVLLHKIANNEQTESIHETTCNEGHSWRTSIFRCAAFQFFNIMTKNFIQSFNNKIYLQRKRKSGDGPVTKKIKKLQSE